MADLLSKIMEYEAGGMEDDGEVLEFFQELVDTGMVHQLQGHYGRTAASLIHAGMIHP